MIDVYVVYMYKNFADMLEKFAVASPVREDIRET